MLLIKAEDVYMEHSGRVVLDIDRLELHDYDRIGLVGANGAGKSSLIKILLGINPLQYGKVETIGTFAYIPQLEDAAVDNVQDYRCTAL